MPDLTPVDHDPFASTSGTPLTPVEGDPFAPPIPTPEERGLVGETVAGFKRGGLQLVDMAGNIARAVDPAGGVDVVRNAGFGLSKFAKERATQPDVAESAYVENNPILGNIPKAAEMVIPSVGIPLAIGVGSAAAGLSAPVAAGVGIVGSGLAFGASQFQDTKERGLEKGLTNEDATTAGIKTGLSEGVLEAASNVIPAAKIFKLGKPVAGSVVKSLFKAPTVGAAVKTLLNDAAQIMTGEVSTEMAQAYTQGLTEKNAGIRPDADPWQESKDVIGPTIALSLMLGGAVGGANKLSKVATERALTNERVGEDARTQAAASVYQGLVQAEEAGSAPAGSAENFMVNALEAIKNKAPLTLSDDLLTPATPKVTVEPDEALVNVLTSMAEGASPSEAVDAHNESVVAAKRDVIASEDARIAEQSDLSAPTTAPASTITADETNELDYLTNQPYDSLTAAEKNRLLDLDEKATPVDSLETYDMSEVHPDTKTAAYHLLEGADISTFAPEYHAEILAEAERQRSTHADVKAVIPPSVSTDTLVRTIDEFTTPTTETIDTTTGEILDEPVTTDPLDLLKGYKNKEAAYKEIKKRGQLETHETVERSDGQVVIVPKAEPVISEPSLAPRGPVVQAGDVSPDPSLRSRQGEKVVPGGKPVKVADNEVVALNADNTQAVWAWESQTGEVFKTYADVNDDGSVDIFSPGIADVDRVAMATALKAAGLNVVDSKGVPYAFGGETKLSAKGQDDAQQRGSVSDEQNRQEVTALGSTATNPAGLRDVDGVSRSTDVNVVGAPVLSGNGQRSQTDTQGAAQSAEDVGAVNGQKTPAQVQAESGSDSNNTLTEQQLRTALSGLVGRKLTASHFKFTGRDSVNSVLHLIAEAFGFKVQPYKASLFGDGFTSPQSPGIIYVNKDGKSSAVFLMGHELTHTLKTKYPELYNELWQYIETTTTPEKLAARRNEMRGTSELRKVLSDAELNEEIVADMVGDEFQKPGFWDKMAEAEPTLFAKTINLVRVFISFVKQNFTRNHASIAYDLKRMDVVTAKVFARYAKLQSDGKFTGDVAGEGIKFAAAWENEKGETNGKDTTAGWLAGATEKAQGSNLGSAIDQLGRMVEERFYDTTKFSPRARKAKEAQVLREWSTKNGLIRDHVAFDKLWDKQAKDGVPIRGNEHDVVFNDDDTVTKRNHLPGTYHVSYRELFDRVALFNHLFGGDAVLTLSGFQETPDGLLPEFSQKYLRGEAARIEQTEKMLEDAGFKRIEGLTAYQLPSTDIILTDVFGENTRQVGDVTVPMDYVIFHGERAKAWLKDQKKATKDFSFDQDEFDKAFDDAGIKFSAMPTKIDTIKAVNDWFKNSNMLQTVIDKTMRFIMPTDRTIVMAASQQNYASIKTLLLRYKNQRQEKAGEIQAAMGDAQHVVKLIEKAFKTKDEMGAFSTLVFKATEYQLHADGAASGWTEESWKAAKMDEATGKTLAAAQAELTAMYRRVLPTAEKKTAHSAMLNQLSKVYLKGREAALAPWLQAHGKDVFDQAEKYNEDYAKAEEWSFKNRKPVVDPKASDEVKSLAATIKLINERFPQLRGDYMPLMRFGDYMVRTVTMDENGETGKRTRTEFFDSQKDALNYVDLINANPTNGLHAQIETTKSLGERGVVNIPAVMIDKLKAAAESRGMSGEALEQLIQDAEALRINMMPRTSTSGNKLHRKGVEGYSENVLKVFASYVRNHANANAGLIHGTKIEQTFRDMGNEIKAYTSEKGYDPKAAIDMDTLYKQLYENERSSSRLKINTFVQGMGKASFMWYLSSPSIWAVQWSQPFMVTIPKMASKFGYATAFKAYTQAAKQYLHGDFSDEKIDKFNRDNNFIGDNIYDLITQSREEVGAKKAALEQQIKTLFNSITDKKNKRLVVLKVLSLQGRIDLSASHSLQDLAAATNAGDKLVDKLSSGGQKVMDKAGFFMQHSETGSRRAAAVASFELALEKEGFVGANDYASDIINDTLFDFDSGNRGKAWQGNTGHILGQFQFFRMHMLGKMLQLAKDSWKGQTPAQQKEARKEAAYMLGTSFALAGAGGTPLALAFGNTLSTALFQAVGYLFGDDDEPWDVKRDFELAVREGLGETTGSVVLKGLPSLLGADISQRIGLGNVGDVVMGDPPAGATGTAKANWYAGRILGPAWGMVSDTIRASDALAEGDLAKAIQYSSPKVLRDFVKTYEMGEHGVQGGGKTLLKAEDVNPYSYALMMVGINPLDVSLASEESRYLKNLSTSLSSRRSGLIKDLATATMDSDLEAKDEAVEAINAWSEKNPKLRITAQELVSGIRKEKKKRDGTLTEKEKMIKAEYGVAGEL